MRFWLSALRHVLARRRLPDTESSWLIVGSTGSGKSEGELVELLRLAERGDCAVVLLDGHGPLAFRAAGHWAARGHEQRMVYEPLQDTTRVLCWNMLPKSAAQTLSQRLLEDTETRDEVAQCFMAQRNLGTLNDRAWTKEWLDAAISLCLSQPDPEPLTSLLHAFRVGSPAYERLLVRSENAEVVAKFRSFERLKRRSEVQYELQTGPARRILEQVCTSEIVRLRSRPGPFLWLEALEERKLITFDGGGIRSPEIKRTLFLLVSLQVIQAIRLHFARMQNPLPVVLVLEEAGALGLVTPFIPLAMQELRKAGLATHLIVQSSLDFGDPVLLQRILSHAPVQAWYQCLSPADQELGAKALANATFDPLQVHFTRTRHVHDGISSQETNSRGEVSDAISGTLRQERRTGTAFLARYRTVQEAYYKTPQLHEQEFRTKLATLRIGERLVRYREGVRQERVTMLRPPRVGGDLDRFTRETIERIRSQPIYLSAVPPEPVSAPHRTLDAAERLRQQASPPGEGTT